MNKKDLLKTLVPGLIPVLIFVVADELWGTIIGMFIAVGVGVIQLLYIYIKEKRAEKFVLVDILLLIALGMVSLLLDNELFFKLKPGIIGLILCALIGVSAFSKRNLVMLMSKRYLKNIEINAQAQQKMHKSLLVMFWILLAHTALSFYAAYSMSNAAWGFISGPLLFILLALFFVYELLKARFMPQNSAHNTLEEWVPLVDEKGRITGKATRSNVHNGSKMLHPVVHLHVFNANLQLLLQKRSNTKQIQPGKWDTAVGGHIDYGENIIDALKRESAEELGLIKISIYKLCSYVWESEIEKELVYSFFTFVQKIPDFDKSEIEEVRFWNFSELKENIDSGIFTPNFKHEFEFILKNQKHIREVFRKKQDAF